MLELNLDMNALGSPESPAHPGGNVRDVMIIGSGPAGMTAAIYSARAMLDTLVLEKLGAGGQVAVTDLVENYPGFPDGINGFELSQKMEEQARKFGASVENATVTGLRKDPDGLLTVTTEGAAYRSRSVIVATGASWKRLGVPGEDRFIGKGVSFCATCDAAFYRGKTVAVVGGGDSAIDESLFLTRFVDRLYVIHRRDQLRANKHAQKRAFADPKIGFIWDTVVTEMTGDEKISGLKLKNVKTGAESGLAVDGVFLFVGLVPNTAEFSLVKRDEQGYILTDTAMSTDVPGIFCAGDCRNTPLRQVATAIGDGAVAAASAEKYLETLTRK